MLRMKKYAKAVNQCNRYRNFIYLFIIANIAIIAIIIIIFIF